MCIRDRSYIGKLMEKAVLDEKVYEKVIPLNNKDYKTKYFNRVPKLHKLVSKYRNENLVNLFDYKIDEMKNEIRLYMEYCNKGNLEDFSRHQELSELQALKLLVNICRGYATLYSMGMVHRDLKPDNIFLHEKEIGSSRRPRMIAKIADFDLCRLLKNETTSSIRGNQDYKAPEIMINRVNRKQRKDDHLSDLYSVGLIVLRAIVGPGWQIIINTDGFSKLKREKWEELIKKHVHKIPLLKELLMGILEKDRSNRWTWQQVAEKIGVEFPEKAGLTRQYDFMVQVKLRRWLYEDELDEIYDACPYFHFVVMSVVFMRYISLVKHIRGDEDCSDDLRRILEKEEQDAAKSFAKYLDDCFTVYIDSLNREEEGKMKRFALNCQYWLKNQSEDMEFAHRVLRDLTLMKDRGGALTVGCCEALSFLIDLDETIRAAQLVDRPWSPLLILS
eukprot:TRINITY_DN19728_c0_g1_i1.p1 TRINITY_DN19728_c0_g1~~TRINITY_DN19728_c0_g1_i1.p1  ORF type:complete len:466 (+),score=40.45 TRINITY_DN19728_c0_g1_i1:61-1398(+)